MTGGIPLDSGTGAGVAGDGAGVSGATVVLVSDGTGVSGVTVTGEGVTGLGVTKSIAPGSMLQ